MKPKRVIDLSLDIVGQGVAWPGAPFPEITRTGYLAKDGFNIEIVKFTTHTSTHIDAPIHMVESLPSIDQLPIEGFVGEGIVFDLRYKQPGDRITSADLEKFKPRVKIDDIILLCTGWGPKRDFTREFIFDFPGLDESGANWVIKSGASAIGIDTLGIDPYSDQNFTAHKALFKGKSKFWVAEGLTNLDKLLDRDRWLIAALPIKIAGASGAQARVIAMEF